MSSSSFTPFRKRPFRQAFPMGSNLTFDMGKASTYRIPARKRARTFRPGFYRTGGFYGRFRRGGELKFLDTAISLTDLTVGAGQVNASLVAIPQDDTQSGRDGRQVIIKSLNIRGTLTTDAGTLFPEVIRIMVVQDKQTNGANPTIAQVLTTNAVNSFRNLENVHRFNVLYDQTFNMPPKHINTAGTSSTVQIKYLKISKKLNMIMDYDSSIATGAIASQRSNGLTLMALSGSTNTVDLVATCRIRFQDK